MQAGGGGGGSLCLGEEGEQETTRGRCSLPARGCQRGKSRLQECACSLAALLAVCETLASPVPTGDRGCASMGAALPAGIPAPPGAAHAWGDPWQEAEPCATSRVKRARLPHGSEEPGKGREGSGGSSRLLPQQRPWTSWEAAGSSAQLVLPTPSSDSSVERGERGGWHLSPVPPCPGTHHRVPSFSPTSLCCSRTCTRCPSRWQGWSLRMGAARNPHPKNYQEHRCHTDHPCIPLSSACLLTTPPTRPRAAFGIPGVEGEIPLESLQPTCCTTKNTPTHTPTP